MLRALAILLPYIALLNYCDAAPGSACKVSKAYDGTCKLRSQCKTLRGIFTIQYKSQDSPQSIGPCDEHEVCCPRRVVWSLSNPEPSPQPNVYQIGRYFKNETTTNATCEFKDQIADICGTHLRRFRKKRVKIVGGNDVDIGDYPWLALLEYEPNEFKCGGSLISTRHVLTAAHCVKSSLPKQVILSEHDISTGPVDWVVRNRRRENITNLNVSVEWAIPHPEYRPLINAHGNDIALIKLSYSVEFTEFIRPICLPLKDYNIDFTNETRFTVAGWGSDNVRQMTDVKKAVYLPYVPADDCQSPLPDNQYICAGGEEGEDSCNGDSGGPLMYADSKWNWKYVIVGVVSSGYRYCGTEGYPGFYTSVYKHLSWIHDMMKNLLLFLFYLFLFNQCVCNRGVVRTGRGSAASVIATMLRALAILLPYIALLNYCDAAPGSACNVSKAYDGTCKLRSQCKTLKGLSTIQYRSQESTQSIGLCGDLEVCCPTREIRSLLVPEPSTPPNVYQNGSYFMNETTTNATCESKDQIADICGTHGRRFRKQRVKIVGGDEVGIGEYPWLALLEYEPNEFKCGGSLISTRHVLTAAHCFRGGLPKHVILSEHDISTGPVDWVVRRGRMENITNLYVSVEWAIPHPEYRPQISAQGNDIALIKLSHCVEFTEFIRPICLPLKDYNIDFTNGTRFTVAGWGSDNVRQMTDVKKAVFLPYVPTEDCQSPLPDNHYICAGGEEGEDSCNGDSGGPLMYVDSKWNWKYVIVGVVSSGYRYCGTEGYPGFYTSVYKHLSWIHDMMKK
ncbi:transmembrane protease serine 9-like [Epargyreus clarus]|uniref:transmembrane protease serine 9-like n=1 Tax=Epargyreus clarus TaxID=520877 RepID=UPI003C2EAFD2